MSKNTVKILPAFINHRTKADNFRTGSYNNKQL